jgi:nitrite reductase/ring-hydroxylating ferredoxin subunit
MMSDSVRVARVSEIPPGTGKEIVFGDHLLAVYQIDGAFYAIDGICPHAGGPLAEGVLQGSIVTCPWHGWQFDVSTGRHCLTPRIQQTRYACRVVDGDVYVDLPADDSA